jgi:hypothetical protein
MAWQEFGGSGPLYSNAKLADYCISRLIDRIRTMQDDED